ncbi:MAG: hypothetical protein QM817_31620 [Archangium sp.]
MMRSFLFIVLVAGSLITGCGPSTTCSTANCDGCCDPTSGKCVTGRDTAVCGHDGADCVACPGSQMCVASSPTGTAGGKCQ